MNKFLRNDFDIRKIFSYHCTPDFNWNDYVLKNSEDDNSQVLGFELETSSGNFIEQEIIDTIIDSYPVILEHDSSVGGYDCEIITQPMTYNYFMEHAEDLKHLLTYLQQYNFTSHDNGSCGLHIHFNKPEKDEDFEQVVSRLWLITETWKDKISIIDGRGWTGYAHNITDDVSYKISEQTISSKWLKEKALDNKGNHSLAINLQHEHDIEIRSPRGTLNANSLIARVQFWTNAYTECLRKQRVERITWNKLVKGSYIETYCKEHDAITLRPIIDMTNTIDIYMKNMTAYVLNVNAILTKALTYTIKNECKLTDNAIDMINENILDIQQNLIKHNEYGVHALKHTFRYIDVPNDYTNALNEVDKEITDIVKPTIPATNTTEREV